MRYVAPLFWLLWSSTVVAQQNTISVRKSCYIPGEGFVATFTDASPKLPLLIGILKATDNLNSLSLRFLQFVYTCGTVSCNSVGPSSGTVSIFNRLPAGEYRAVLLRQNSFAILAVSANFTVASACPSSEGNINATSNSVTVGKTCYVSREGVLASFFDSFPQVGDRIGLIDSATDVGSTTISYPAVVFTCGTFVCSGAPRSGDVSIFNNLSPGQYKAVLLRGTLLRALATSAPFTIADACAFNTVPTFPVTKSPTNFPTLAPGPPPTIAPSNPATSGPTIPRVPVTVPMSSSISVGRSCYQTSTIINVTFVDVDAQPSDLIGLVNSSFDVLSGNKFYPTVAFVCGSNNCVSAPASGSLAVFQALPPNEYKAVLLRGSQLEALAVSANFTITNTSCPGSPPTPAPGYSIRVAKSCYLSQQAVVTNFSDPDAQIGDGIGLIEASVDVEVRPIVYPAYLQTCGSFICNVTETSGTVNLYQVFAPGLYKAVLLRGTRLYPLAVSANFNISTNCTPST